MGGREGQGRVFSRAMSPNSVMAVLDTAIDALELVKGVDGKDKPCHDVVPTFLSLAPSTVKNEGQKPLTHEKSLLQLD